MDYNLDDKINLLYDFIYNQNTKNCFSIDKITLGKIGLDDIKLSIPESNIEEENTFYELNKTNILNGRFKILSFDEDNYQLYLKKYSNQFPITVKISFYNKSDNKNNLFNSPINNDSLFSFILSELILYKKTKHLILPLINIDVNISDIEKIISDNDYVYKIKNLIKNNNIQEVCCLQLREHFFKSIILTEYLEKNQCIYKGLLFQVIHTLAILQKEFPGFKHNNLILKNIFVYLKKNDNDYIEYEGFKNDKFYLPNIGFDIKITNFEKSIISKYYEINTDISNEPNQYYDLYTFMNDLISFKTINDCDKETSKFFDKYLPVDIRNKFTNNIEIIKPQDLLYDKYFDNFMKKSSSVQSNSIINHQYIIGKNKIIETYMNSDNHSILGEQNKIKSNIDIMVYKRVIKKENFNSKKKINRIELEMLDEMIGGYDKQEQAPYKKEKNTPFTSNDERDTFNKKKNENPIREPPILLEQKIYDTSKKPDKKPEFPPPYIPLYDESNGQIIPHTMPYSNILAQPPIQKVYNISLSNPIGNHSMINRIYEDMLPGQPHVFSALTIYERIQLSNFLKNTIIDNHDGEDMDITGGKNSLLSFIKVMECNPYATKQNPYHDLARDFLLYRAAYPIRYNEKSNIEIAKQSMGMNVRMYRMSIGDIKSRSISSSINQDNFDLWREIKYYNWVKDYIIRNKISPNFISPFLYKIDTNSRIDWSKLELLKKKVQIEGITDSLIKNQKKINNLHTIKKSLGQLSLILPKNLQNPSIKLEYNKIMIEIEENRILKENKIQEKYTGIERDTRLNIVKEEYDNKIKNIREKYKNIKDIEDIEEIDDITANSGKVLILLTEAPTSNILQWAGPIYDKFGIIRRMVSTGYHTPEVWKSILFQLVYACSVLQKSKILIENFSLENNIFIKDIFTDYNAIGSWIYKVDSIDYYIPNYGYILMIDSKFKDINTDFNVVESNDQHFKIYGEIYKNNSIYNDKVDLDNRIIKQIKEVINPDNFRHKISVGGSSRPDADVIDLIWKIHNDIKTNTDISKLIPKYFSEFVHNRVGTLLLKSEKENINKMSRPNFNNGNLMVYQKRFNEYEWVILVGKSSTLSDLHKSIITKKDGKYTVINVFNGSLFGYPENEKIIPESNNNMKYDENHIYETYNLDNLHNI